MALAPAAALGWRPNGTNQLGGFLLWETTSDWLEIDVDLKRGPKGVIRDSRTPDPVWTVTLVLMVGCWCRDNHNAHYIDEHRWDVGTVDALAERSHAAYSVADRWITASIDADYWRRQAGLPLRPGSNVSKK